MDVPPFFVPNKVFDFETFILKVRGLFSPMLSGNILGYRSPLTPISACCRVSHNHQPSESLHILLRGTHRVGKNAC